MRAACHAGRGIHLIALVAVLLWSARAAPQAAGDPAGDLEVRVAELRASGDYDRALEAARELATLTREAPGAMPYETADAERLVATLVSVVGLDGDLRGRLATADSLSRVAEGLWEGGRFAEGASCVERELSIRREVLGEDHPEVATAVNNLAALLHGQGQLERAEALYEEALEKKRRLLGEAHPDVAFTLNNLASLRHARGDYVGAAAYLREALVLLEGIFGEEHPLATASLLNLAGVLKAQGKYAEAEPLYRRALSVRRSVLGEEHRDVAESMTALASVLTARGDYASAEPLYREALAMRRRLLGEDHPAVAASLNGLAFVLEAQGDYASAEPLFREALALRVSVLGPDHPLVAQSLNNLAAVLHKRGDYAAAEPYYRHALEIRGDVLGEEHPLTASSMYNLGSLLMAKEEYAAAEELFRSALAIRRRVFGDVHPSIAYNLQSLGILLYERGDYAAAESFFSEALALRRELLGEEHPHVSVTLQKYALLLKAEDDYASAEPILEQACSIYDAARMRTSEGIARATFLDCPYADLAQAKLVLGREREAWPAAERALARTLADLLLESASRDLSPEESAREEELCRDLADREREVAAYREASASDSSGQAARGLIEARNGLLDAEAAWGAFQRMVAEKYPVTEGRAFPLDRVQSALARNEAIIGWLDVEVGKGRFDSWAYVVRSDGPVRWAHLAIEGTSPFDRTARFREDLADPGTATIALELAGGKLWAERFEPIEDALAGIDRLIVVPSGAMLGVPVEPLVGPGGRCVGDRFAVSYVPSATVCAWLSERAEGGAATGALLVGDPPFSEAQRAAMEEASAMHGGEGIASGDRERQAKEVLASLPRLPGTRREILGLARVLPEATILLGPDASEEELVRLADEGRLAGFRTIHLATHAHVDNAWPGRSSLILSQVDLPDPLDAAVKGDRIYDGLLTAAEIVREWDLDADLVTLSACGTALGREAGGEGYLGLAHAFFQAGARSLLVSLWKVEDRATSLLMTRFYENRTGSYDDERAGLAAAPMPKDAALREAKAWLRGFLDASGDRPYERPFYWSAFVLLGERS